MAERSVSFLIAKLGSLLLEEANFLGGVKTQILSLHDELEWINSFLRDADAKRRSNRRVNLWVSQVKSLAFDAEDIIDLYMLQIVQQRQRNMVKRFMGSSKYLFTLHMLGKEMEDINRRIEKISANKLKYGVEAFETGQTLARLDDGLARKRRRDTMEEEVDDVGFEKDSDEVATLLKQEDSRQLLVVPIVGMGGLGKTTLAKKVYNRSDVKNTFDSCAWVYVSQEYRIKDLLSGAIAQLMMHPKKELETKDEEDLVRILSGHLKEKRCMIVFDDVWKREDWDRLKLAFLVHQGEGKQQRVLLTTRNVEVAKHADPLIAPYELGLLGVKESFEHFSKKVFQYQERIEERSYSKDLEDLGKKLVARCEDYEISSQKLIRIWVAEGFILQRGEETMEDTAEEYLEELIDRSMIQAASRRPDGGVEKCRIHDLLWDLAVSEAKKDKLLEIYGSSNYQDS
ncbi:disease resistance protein RPP13-like [Macadamia integrifolia]|uniref:disease resistance protein RPP13-like n=1 Tax=Macadamia integrifolia TaxID=60698 RepID=UPI001C4F4BF3|nr:disease resistance protein RPP13-like [Macadamia integrifolia]